MAKNQIWKIIMVFSLVAIIFSFWGGERDHPNYALGIIKEDYEQSGNPFSRTTQAALTVAFNHFFSEKELDFSVQIEFVSFQLESHNMREKVENFLDQDWEVIAFIGSTDPASTKELSEIALEYQIPLLSPFFHLEGGEYSFSLAPKLEQIAFFIKQILSNELEKEEAIILGANPAIKSEILQDYMENLGIFTEMVSILPEEPIKKPILVLDPHLLESHQEEIIFVLPVNLEVLPDFTETFYALLSPALAKTETPQLNFIEEYRDMIGTPDYFAFNAYDSLYYILEILHAAGSQPPDMQKSFFFFETNLLGGHTSFSQEGFLISPLIQPVKISDGRISLIEYK